MLEADGLEGFAPVRNARGTVKAPYVNAEESEYLVLEDAFPNGRPPLEKAGFFFTDRETVDKVERMKVCTCLNPLHTAQEYVQDFKLGEKPDCAKLEGLLRNRTIFGVDLVEAGLADRVCAYFTELTAGPGAVRDTLHKYMNQE